MSEAVKKRRKHYTIGGVVWTIVKYASLIFFGLCAVVPVISCIITAFKTDTEYAQTNVMTLPENWLNFDNFVKAFTTRTFGYSSSACSAKNPLCLVNSRKHSSITTVIWHFLHRSQIAVRSTLSIVFPIGLFGLARKRRSVSSVSSESTSSVRQNLSVFVIS